jgi:hypothetical protein
MLQHTAWEDDSDTSGTEQAGLLSVSTAGAGAGLRSRAAAEQLLPSLRSASAAAPLAATSRWSCSRVLLVISAAALCVYSWTEFGGALGSAISGGGCGAATGGRRAVRAAGASSRDMPDSVAALQKAQMWMSHDLDLQIGGGSWLLDVSNFSRAARCDAADTQPPHADADWDAIASVSPHAFLDALNDELISAGVWPFGLGTGGTKRIDIIIRVWAAQAFVLPLLFRSIDLFWPKRVGRCILIFDEDEQFMEFSYAPSYCVVYYEALPPLFLHPPPNTISEAPGFWLQTRSWQW